MEELLDVYTRDGVYLGVQPRELFSNGNPGFYNKPAWTWVYNSKNEILVQKRASSKKLYPDYWDMSCAGHIDAGETIVQGVIREAKEEIGIDIKEEDLEFVHLYYPYEEEYVNVFFKANKYEGVPTIKESDKCDSLKWFNIKDLPDNIIPKHKNVIECMDKKVMYDDRNATFLKLKLS